jgi:hypothetical protein
LAGLGVPAAEILDEYEQLRAQTDEIARRFTELFRRRMWKPFVKRGMPADQIPPLLQTLETLAPLASGRDDHGAPALVAGGSRIVRPRRGQTTRCRHPSTRRVAR